jgi:hypothetical protein
MKRWEKSLLKKLLLSSRFVILNFEHCPKVQRFQESPKEFFEPLEEAPSENIDHSFKGALPSPAYFVPAFTIA